MPKTEVKDVAIFYPRARDEQLEKFVPTLVKALETNGFSASPAYTKTGKLAKLAVKSRFRVFLINSEFLEEIESKDNYHYEILHEESSKDTTLLIPLHGAPREHDLYEELTVIESFLFLENTAKFSSQAKSIVNFIKQFITKTSESEYSEETDASESDSVGAVPTQNRNRRLSSDVEESPSQDADVATCTWATDKDLNISLNGSEKPKYTTLISAAAVVALAALVAFFLFRSAKEQRELTTSEKFVNKIDALETEFSDQDQKFWRTVRSTMKRHIIDEDPRQPTVLMLVSTKSARNVRESLTKKIAEAYSARCNDNRPVMVSGDDYVAVEHSEAKEQIDDVISSGFGSSSCAAIISNFERIPPASTTTFYQFCENDLAPFKTVAVIFTLEIAPGSWDHESEFNSLKDGEIPDRALWDKIVENYLYHSLESRDRSGIMKKDMIGGLLSRITPAVAWVRGRGVINEL